MWNSSMLALSIASPYADRPIQTLPGTPRLVGLRVMLVLVPATSPLTYRVPTVPDERHGQVDPLAGGDRRGAVDLLLAAGAGGGDGEAGRVAGRARPGGEEHVDRGALPEVEDPAPALGGGEVDPGRDREVGELGDRLLRQFDVLGVAAAVELQRVAELAGHPPDGQRLGSVGPPVPVMRAVMASWQAASSVTIQSSLVL